MKNKIRKRENDIYDLVRYNAAQQQNQDAVGNQITTDTLHDREGNQTRLGYEIKGIREGPDGIPMVYTEIHRVRLDCGHIVLSDQVYGQCSQGHFVCSNCNLYTCSTCGKKLCDIDEFDIEEGKLVCAAHRPSILRRLLLFMILLWIVVAIFSEGIWQY